MNEKRFRKFSTIFVFFLFFGGNFDSPSSLRCINCFSYWGTYDALCVGIRHATAGVSRHALRTAVAKRLNSLQSPTTTYGV